MRMRRGLTLNSPDPVTPSIILGGRGAATLAAPDAPVLTLDSYTGNTITVSWPAVSGATSYKIYKDGVLVDAAATSPYTVTGLTGNTSYALTAKAVNAGGDSVVSNTITQTTLDASAAAYFAANTGLTDATIKAAVNQLYIDLKAASLYTKFKGLWLLHLGSQSLCKWNLINPVDSDGAYRLTYSGGLTFASGGVTGNGSTNVINTHLAASVEFTVSSGCIGTYNRTNVAGGYCLSASDASTAKEIALISRYSDSRYYANYGKDGSYISVANTDSRGLFCVNRNGTTNTEQYKNGSSVNAAAQASPALSSQAFYISCQNRNGTAIEFSTKQYALAFAASGMTSGEQSSLYTAIQAYMTALSLNV